MEEEEEISTLYQVIHCHELESVVKPMRKVRLLCRKGICGFLIRSTVGLDMHVPVANIQVL